MVSNLADDTKNIKRLQIYLIKRSNQVEEECAVYDNKLTLEKKYDKEMKSDKNL